MVEKSMIDSNCYYHQDQTATDVCDVCGKNICLECKKIFHEAKPKKMRNVKNHHYARRELCPVCLFDAQKRYTKQVKIGAIITAVVFILFLISAIQMGAPASFIGFVLIIMITGILFSVVSNLSSGDPGLKKEEFLESLGLGTEGIKKDKQVSEMEPGYCNHCGEELTSEDLYCVSCGKKK